jgi:O-antigen/teichoic acid export membrane protein
MVNVLLNFALSPFYGPIGAAIGTSVSFLAGAFFLRRAIAHHFAVRI